VKKTSPGIDRATLIKGGGTAALATLLAGALQGRAEACCSPIDLTYTDDPPQLAALTRRRMGKAVTGLWLWSEGAKTTPDSTWTLLYSIPSAHVKGNDENGSVHSKDGRPKPLGYTINVYVKY
jgi:hypothetical protein